MPALRCLQNFPPNSPGQAGCNNNQNEQPRHEVDDEVQSTNIHANHDLQAEAPQSTEESPMTENACGPSQDQVKMNMPEKGKENEENTSPLEGGTSHLSSPLEVGTSHFSSHEVQIQIKIAQNIDTFPNPIARHSDL
jgi:hypothetical protein